MDSGWHQMKGLEAPLVGCFAQGDARPMYGDQPVSWPQSNRAENWSSVCPSRQEVSKKGPMFIKFVFAAQESTLLGPKVK